MWQFSLIKVSKEDLCFRSTFQPRSWKQMYKFIYDLIIYFGGREGGRLVDIVIKVKINIIFMS